LNIGKSFYPGQPSGTVPAHGSNRPRALSNRCRVPPISQRWHESMQSPHATRRPCAAATPRRQWQLDQAYGTVLTRLFPVSYIRTRTCRPNPLLPPFHPKSRASSPLPLTAGKPPIGRVAGRFLSPREAAGAQGGFAPTLRSSRPTLLPTNPDHVATFHRSMARALLCAPRRRTVA
jgi:hypothetical protein